MQSKLNNWEVIAAQVNKQKRINWNNYLDHSLTDEITKHRLKGLNSDNIYKVIKSKLLLADVDDPEILRRLKISVCARCGEQTAYKNRIRKVF